MTTPTPAQADEKAPAALLSAREQLEGYEHDATGESYNDTQINAAIDELQRRAALRPEGEAVACTYCGDTGTVYDRVDGEITCPECGYAAPPAPAQAKPDPVAPAGVKEMRKEVMRLMREDFDPTPPGWEGREWDDNAEDVADKILAVTAGANSAAMKAVRAAKMLINNINEFGQVTDPEFLDCAEIAVKASLLPPSTEAVRAVSDNGKRWRIVPDDGDWEMQPVGHITARQAERLCKAIEAALSPAPAQAGSDDAGEGRS